MVKNLSGSNKAKALAVRVIKPPPGLRQAPAPTLLLDDPERTQEYAGEQGFGSSAVRERGAHGRAIQNELRVALRAADQTKPADARLEQSSGTFIEVELRRGTRACVRR
jgi:hypothetical protein